MTLTPQSIDELCDAIAGSAPAPVALRGGGTKRTQAPGSTTIDLRGLSGIVTYDPAECVMTALGGTPLQTLHDALAAHHQYLPFDPPLAAAGATIGGTVAAGLSGAGRYRYGGVRDFIIGARVVDGEGRLLRTGGQVVKNAAGFLLHHALVGSAGRFGAIAELSCKVFPRPMTTRTLCVAAGAADTALAAHDRVVAAVPDLDAVDVALDTGMLWIRLAGAAAAVEARVARVRSLLTGDNVIVLDDDAATAAWADAAAFRWTAGATRLVKVPTSASSLREVAARAATLGPARSTCGGAAVLVATDAPLEAITAALPARVAAVVVRGADAGHAIGLAHDTVFHERVRRTLDPGMRFL